MLDYLPVGLLFQNLQLFSFLSKKNVDEEVEESMVHCIDASTASVCAREMQGMSCPRHTTP